jgi:hypothetical protein
VDLSAGNGKTVSLELASLPVFLDSQSGGLISEVQGLSMRESSVCPSTRLLFFASTQWPDWHDIVLRVTLQRWGYILSMTQV